MRRRIVSGGWCRVRVHKHSAPLVSEQEAAQILFPGGRLRGTSAPGEPELQGAGPSRSDSPELAV